jgi:hypothetical protein
MAKDAHSEAPVVEGNWTELEGTDKLGCMT